MTSLTEKLNRIIDISGPISLAEYMHICMADPQFGYYQNQMAIGSKGDFITAPEVSQIFGELIGIWCIDAWQKLGEPKEFCLCELGPGKGTLMLDLLRTAKIAPQFLKAANVTLVETSPIMRASQKKTLSKTNKSISWQDDLNNLPQIPTIIVANEFLDVLPIRQYIKSGKVWSERGIANDKDGNLTSVLIAGTLEDALLPEGSDKEPDGAVFEISPAREAIIETIADKFNRHSGAALFIDYGHAISGYGDTFQAMRAHKFTDPLEQPGLADLTSHVDFERLAAAAAKMNITPRISTQSEFLLSLGLLERAGSLGQNSTQAEQDKIRNAVERLASDEQMGTLFKVLTLTNI